MTDDLDRRVAAAHAAYAAAHPVSRAAHERARRVLPGGNTRSVLHFDPFPFRVASASGSVLHTVDGHAYTDFVGNYTAGLLGHDPAVVRDAVAEAMASGWALGAVHERETELAELLCARFPSLERVRFTNSGTEANLMAVGLALHHTGRSGVAVFDRGYHGGVAAFGPVEAGGAANPLNVPHRWVVSPYDDPDALDTLFADDDLACVLVEPVQGSGGARPASIGWLTELRDRCHRHGVVLIFDEVMTSRLSPGGAQQRFGVTPDLTTLGKYLGGGLSFGAFGGRADILDHFDPAAGGQLTQAGTFNNNVASMAAALATIRHELRDDRLEAVNALGDRLHHDLAAVLAQAGVPLWVTGVGSMQCVHAEDDRLVEVWFHHCLAAGLYPARRGFLALSMALDADDTGRLVDATATFARSLA